MVVVAKQNIADSFPIYGIQKEEKIIKKDRSDRKTGTGDFKPSFIFFVVLFPPGSYKRHCSFSSLNRQFTYTCGEKEMIIAVM